MCGFVAFLSKYPDVARLATPAWIRGVTDVLSHRGPDDSGIEITGPVALGFRRLSILDLSPAGHQPMVTADGRVSMVFNGEIYNYVELRSELAQRGHHFHSTGDTEVLLRGYLEWGEGVLDRLVGMFAFCIVDRTRQQLFLARDHFGIKPLYYANTAEGWIFASEIKGIRASGLVSAAPRTDRWAEFFARGRTEDLPEDGGTFLTGIEQLEAGETMTLSFSGDVRRRFFWRPDDVRDSGDATVEEIREAFDESVRVQLRSDVPVGVMLSGGIDSVSIACRVATLQADLPATRMVSHAFCYRSSMFDESAQLDATLAATRFQPHTLGDVSATRIWEALPTVVWHHDEPFHSPTVLVGYELYRMAAAEGVRVVMSGQGADEAFAGYPTFLRPLLSTLMLRGRVNAMVQQARAFAEHGTESASLLLRSAFRTSLSVQLRRSSLLQSRHERQRAERVSQFGHLSPELRDLLMTQEPESPPVDLGVALRRAISSSPLPKYLRAEDRNSMANSVEARVPFLDHRLVSAALRLPPEERMWDGWNKIGLRKAMRGRIPAVVSERRVKFGFPTSARDWFAGALAPRMKELLLDGPLSHTGWLSLPRLEQMINEHQNGVADHTDRLFAAAQAAMWLDLHDRGWQSPTRAPAVGSDRSAALISA
jgi:asparagine synthase (glutamine-hydrolysing)